MLIKRASLEQQQLEQISALAVLHDQGLVGGVLKDAIQLGQALAHQAPHQLDFTLHSQEVFGLHLGLLIGLDDDRLPTQRTQSFVHC